MEKLDEQIILLNVLYNISHDPLMLQHYSNPKDCLIVDTNKQSNGYYLFGYEIAHGNRLIQFDQIPATLCAMVPVDVLDKGYIENFVIAEGINTLSRNEGLYFLVPDHYIFNRQNNILPDFKIGTDIFEYDGENEILVPKDGLTEPIPLSALTALDYGDANTDGDMLEGFYHVASRQILEMDFSAHTHWPRGVVYINIPGSLICDPIGVARKNGSPDMAHISLQCPTTGYSATVFDSSNSFYQQKHNNKAEVTQHQEVAKKRKIKKLPF